MNAKEKRSTLMERARMQTRSVRGRTTAVAVVVVGAALIVASIGLVVGLRVSLTNYLRTAAQLRAEDVADVLEGGVIPTDLAVDDDEEVFVQVIGPDGEVVAASPNVAGEGRVATLAAGQSARVRDLSFEDDEFIVVAASASTIDGPHIVLVGRNTEVIGESAGTVIRFLGVGVPLITALVAAMTWRLAGRALAPVDEIRNEVDQITAAELDSRVSLPGTGDEVARLATTMNGMLQRLEDAQRRQRRFVADASHELRSPLATIRQHAEVALNHPDRTTTQDLAEVVLAEDLRLEHLVGDLLLLARTDERAVLSKPRPVDVDDLALEELARLRRAQNLRVDSAGLSAGRVLGDAALLRRLVANLVDNAARHAATTVSLTLNQDGDDVVLVVEDDGEGVPDAERERIFGRFVRLDAARSRDAGGAGLGLSIVTAVVDAHGGSITVDDSALGGARFEVRIPAL